MYRVINNLVVVLVCQISGHGVPKVGGVSCAGRQYFAVTNGPHIRGFTTPRSISSTLMLKLMRSRSMQLHRLSRRIFQAYVGMEPLLLKDAKGARLSCQSCSLSAIELLPAQKFEVTPTLNEIHFAEWSLCQNRIYVSSRFGIDHKSIVA
jgi:hypothetical protein